jgi:hypothetical protein
VEKELPRKVLAILKTGNQPQIRALAAFVRAMNSATCLRDPRCRRIATALASYVRALQGSAKCVCASKKYRRFAAAVAAIAGTGIVIEMLDHMAKVLDSTAPYIH